MKVKKVRAWAVCWIENLCVYIADNRLTYHATFLTKHDAKKFLDKCNKEKQYGHYNLFTCEITYPIPAKKVENK